MRRLAVAAAAFAVGLLLLFLLFCRRQGSIVKLPPPPELPLSRVESRPLPSPTKRNRRRRHLHLLLMLCSGRRRTRVEPTSANSAESSPAQQTEEVAAWRERWFGPVSRALYTIEEEDEAESTGGDKDVEEPELETPFYTPPASPPRLISGISPSAS